MKKIVLLIAIAFSVSLMFAQSSCCKNKAKDVSCTHSAKAVDATKGAADNEVMPACCKNKSDCKTKAEQGISCCKNKQKNIAPSCSSKKWWQIWKKGCNKPCCKKS